MKRSTEKKSSTVSEIGNGAAVNGFFYSIKGLKKRQQYSR